jgi:hypothetical protein
MKIALLLSACMSLAPLLSEGGWHPNVVYRDDRVVTDQRLLLIRVGVKKNNQPCPWNLSRSSKNRNIARRDSNLSFSDEPDQISLINPLNLGYPDQTR